MIVLRRLQRTFRERAPEWVLATISFGWGFTLLLPGASFNRPFFAPLKMMAPEVVWGSVMVAIGILRLGALYINGSMRQTPRVRQVGSFFGMLVWALLLAGALSVGWFTPSIFTYAGLFALEGIMFSYSAADAARNAALRVTGDGDR